MRVPKPEKTMTLLVNPDLPGDSFIWPGHGPQAATGILLFHGFTATTAEVRPLAIILAEAGFTISGPLLPGHKTRPEDLNAAVWKDWVDAAEKSYQGLAGQCRRVIVGGESMGGLMALFLAARHPELAAILTYSPAFELPLSSRLFPRLLAPFVEFSTPKPGPRTVVDDRWQGYPVRPIRAVVQLDLFRQAVHREVAGIRQPLLLIQGRLDTTIDTRGAQSLYDRVSSLVKELHWMEKSTHCVILDQELAEVAELSLKFIANLSQAETQ
jgi:carboxylesterase